MSTKEALRAILARDGKIDPEVVVKEATPEDSPLHNHFEWDQDAAAEAYRLQQAEQLIRRVKVTITKPDNQNTVVRAFVNVRKKETDKKGFYIDTQEALKNEFYREQVLKSAVREAKSFHDKYQGLDELSDILNSISGFLSERECEDTQG